MSCESRLRFLCLAQIVSLPVTEALIERECSVQVRKWRESRGELMHQPARRFHGTRAIYEYKRRAASISSGGSLSFLGSPIPPPGPLRASSSLLSLPGFRKSKAPFQTQAKKSSFSSVSGTEAPPPQSPPASSSRGPAQKPPLPPAQKPATPHVQSPLVGGAAGPPQEPRQAAEGASAPSQPPPPAAPPSTLSPAPVIVSEQITPSIPSPTANNAPLQPRPDTPKEAAPTAPASSEDDGKKKKKKKSKEDKKKEKEDEKKKVKEKKEKEKVEKERAKREKEKLEKERRGKKKDKGGGEAEDTSGAAAAKESA